MRETLRCATGHDWTRDVVPGRKPPRCPEHRGTSAKPAERRTEAPRPIVKPAKPVKRTERATWIQAVLDASPNCRCEIHPEMTDDELMAVKSCTAGWQCGTLTRIRTHHTDYNRHRPVVTV